MPKPENSADLLRGFGSSAAHKFDRYKEHRIQELYRKLENAGSMNEVLKIQGAIQEVKRVAASFSSLSRNLEEDK